MLLRLKYIALGSALLFSSASFAHYPVLSCQHISNAGASDTVRCEASFSNRAKAPNVIMEVYSEDDDVLASGYTDDNAIYEFEAPDNGYFILMDAGPGHVLEISNDEVVNAS